MANAGLAPAACDWTEAASIAAEATRARNKSL